MAKIFLVSLNTRHTHSSLSLAYLQAFWQRIPSRPKIFRLDFDLNQGIETLLARLIWEEPTLVGFSTYIWSLNQVLNLSGALKAALPGCRIVLGGPEVSFDGERVMKSSPWIDGLVLGEGEQTFEELAERHLSGENWSGVPGLIYREKEKLAFGGVRNHLMNLDELPSPFLAGMYGKGQGFTYYEGSRGCPFRCTYCLSSVLGPVRNFSLERVKADLDWFMTSEFSQVRFADRTFNYDVRRACSILEYILKTNKRGVKFHLELKPDLLQEEVIDLLGEAPPELFHLEIGVQSTDPEALNQVNRKCDIGLMERKIISLQTRTKCHIHLDLLAGMPGENFPAFKKTLDQAFAWGTRTIQVGLVKVLKGTELQKKVDSGEMFTLPYPPYAVVRSQWLSAREVVKIQEMGKLVEGLYNPGRFQHSLRFIIHHLFQGIPSRFFESLGEFWRVSGRPFYSFSTDAVMQGLNEFLASMEVGSDIRRAFDALVLHEHRMNQKVPLGKAGPIPEFKKTKASHGFKLAPGKKVFWYDLDPVPLLHDPSLRKFPSHPGPVIYDYETDLSKTPTTRFMDLSLEERLFLSAVDHTDGAEDLAPLFGQYGEPAMSEQKFLELLDKFRQNGVIFKPRKNNAPNP